MRFFWLLAALGLVVNAQFELAAQLPRCAVSALPERTQLESDNGSYRVYSTACRRRTAP
jgi:hypothetical protein